MMHHLEKPLDFTEELFVLEYIGCRSYKKAGEAVGLSEKEVHLLTKRKAFHEAVGRLTSTALGRAEVTAQRIVDALADIGFAAEDLEKYRDPQDGRILQELIPKTGDRIRALELLGKWSQIKMFTEVVETNNNDESRVKTVELEERIKLMEQSRDPSLLEGGTHE